MKAILQRVLSASVSVDDKLISEIGKGILVFAAIAPGDTEKEVDQLAVKVCKIRLWDDENGGRWKHSINDIHGSILCISQFTLLASTKKGSKPDFHAAANPEHAKALYSRFVEQVRKGVVAGGGGGSVGDGVFQAMMQVKLVNDGPVTIEMNVDAPKSVEETRK